MNTTPNEPNPRTTEPSILLHRQWLEAVARGEGAGAFEYQQQIAQWLTADPVGALVDALVLEYPDDPAPVGCAFVLWRDHGFTGRTWRVCAQRALSWFVETWNDLERRRDCWGAEVTVDDVLDDVRKYAASLEPVLLRAATPRGLREATRILVG